MRKRLNDRFKNVNIVYKMAKMKKRHLLNYFGGGITVYIYNLDTGTLHMKGGCHHSKVHPNHIKIFASEREARDFAGEKIQWCIPCQKKREEKMKEV